MNTRLLTLAVIGAVGTGSAASIATAHGGGGERGPISTTPVATVTSYSSGTLTLKLSSGETVSGAVTSRTRVVVRGAAPTTPGTTPDSDYPGGTTPPTTPRRAEPGDDDRGAGPGGRGRGPRGDDFHRGAKRGNNLAALVSGASVLQASTELTASGQRFTRIVIAASSSATTPSDAANYTSY